MKPAVRSLHPVATRGGFCSPLREFSQACAVTVALVVASCGHAEHGPLLFLGDGSGAARAPGAELEGIQVDPPPLTEGVFPCSDCHDPDIPVRTERRPMEMSHEEIVFAHDEANRWCLDCHDTLDRDMLRLASGELIPFEESHRLCGQCHGDKYRDWRAGVHGRRTGNWDGQKTYRLCVHCHDSHDPAFKPIEPMPPPARPERTR